MIRCILLFMSVLFYQAGFSQNKEIEKIWQLVKTDGNVYTHEAIDKLIADEDVLKYEANGDVIAIPATFVDDENENTTAELAQPEIIGKWSWIDKSNIEFQYYQRGWLMKKKFSVSKLTDKELILILLPE